MKKLVLLLVIAGCSNLKEIDPPTLDSVSVSGVEPKIVTVSEVSDERESRALVSGGDEQEVKELVRIFIEDSLSSSGVSRGFGEGERLILKLKSWEANLSEKDLMKKINSEAKIEVSSPKYRGTYSATSEYLHPLPDDNDIKRELREVLGAAVREFIKEIGKF